MKILIEMDCDNAAFEDRRYAEIFDNLQSITEWAARIGTQSNNPGTEKTSNIVDSNGNTCGTVKVIWE